jgi:hypothetical protein
MRLSCDDLSGMRSCVSATLPSPNRRRCCCCWQSQEDVEHGSQQARYRPAHCYIRRRKFLRRRQSSAVGSRSFRSLKTAASTRATFSSLSSSFCLRSTWDPQGQEGERGRVEDLVGSISSLVWKFDACCRWGARWNNTSNDCLLQELSCQRQQAEGGLIRMNNVHVRCVVWAAVLAQAVCCE